MRRADHDDSREGAAASFAGAEGQADEAAASTQTRRQYWQKNLRITRALLTIWFVVTFVVSYFARDLDFSFFGWPFSFWVGAQGSLIVYLIIVAVYAHCMNRLDRDYGGGEAQEE